MSSNILTLEGKEVALKSLGKMYFADKGIIKADVIEYYLKIAPLLLPHLYNRPISMIFFPDAMADKSFYQKQRPDNAPEFLQSVRIESAKRGHIDYVLINDTASLIYLVNRGMLEAHAWFSRADMLDNPDIAALDIDPSGDTGFKEAVLVASKMGEILSELGIYSLAKTSGASGMHIFIPLKRQHSYAKVQQFLKMICGETIKRLPKLCTMERTISKRGNRVYLDAVQCNRGKTLAMPYSMRVKSGALVSTPLYWSEVNSSLRAEEFDITTVIKRIERLGDLSADLYAKAQSLKSAITSNGGKYGDNLEGRGQLWAD